MKNLISKLDFKSGVKEGVILVVIAAVLAAAKAVTANPGLFSVQAVIIARFLVEVLPLLP